VVTFMQDLDMYFELKKVPENLKLPLVLRAIKDPVAQNWVSSEYHKIDSYQSFKAQFSKLSWNELEQSRVRCDIYQGKYDRNGDESRMEHYIRYASLAAKFQPLLTKYNLAKFTKRKKRKEVVQRERKGGGHLRTCVILHFEKVVWYCVVLYCIVLYKIGSKCEYIEIRCLM
jgi:hypothetical protein